MAIIKGIKVSKKAPKRDPIMIADEKRVGAEPVWDYDRALEMPQAEYDSHLRKSLNYYNYFYTSKDLKKYVIEWMKGEKKHFTPEDVTAFQKANDNWLPMTACGLVKATTQGMPLHERGRDYLISKIREVIAASGPVEEEEKPKETKAKAYVPTIQDRLREKLAEVLGEMEGDVDLVFKGKAPVLKVYDHLTVNKVPQAQIGKIVAIYESKKAELVEAQTDKDQLKEAYSYLAKKDFARIIAHFDAVLEACAQYAQIKKAQKAVRVKKAPSKDKVVSKLKYCVEDKGLKIMSIPPSTILGAQELWVYNVKTRKLGKYVADAHSSLGVKGTTITGYSEAASVAKTLRKPAEQLKEFMAAGKVQLRKYLENIKAVDVKLNGRISADILLLKVQ